MAPPTFDTLLPELQLSIIDYIPRPTDMKNLSRVSKTTHSIVTTRLYSKVDIDLNHCKCPQPDGSYSFSNNVLRHIRKLAFEPSTDAVNDPENALRVVKHTLEILPQDALLSLCLPSQLQGDLDLILLIASRQRKVQTLNLGGASTALEGAFSSQRCPPGWPRYLKDLRLSTSGAFCNLSSLRGHAQIVKRTTSLRSLSLWLDTEADTTFTAALQDTAYGDGALTATFFGQIGSSGPGKLLTLQQLSLSGVCLSWSDRTFARVIDLRKLRALHLWDCDGVAVFLGAFAEVLRNGGCALSVFVFESFGTFPSKDICAFLKASSGLKILTLSAADPLAVLDLQFLAGHFLTLKVLAVDLCCEITNEDDVMSLSAGQEALEFIALNGHGLQELAVYIDVIGLILPETSSTSFAAYPMALEALIKLPNLRILRLGDWPLAPPGLFRCEAPDVQSWVEAEELYVARYFTQMDLYATRLMRHIAKVRKDGRLSKLAVLCFDNDFVYEQGGEHQLWVRRQCYVPGTMTDVYGQARVCATRMSMTEVKWVEGHSVLFED